MSLYKGLRRDCLHNELETAVFIKGLRRPITRRAATPPGSGYTDGHKALRMRQQVLTISEIPALTRYLQKYSKGKTQYPIQ